MTHENSNTNSIVMIIDDTPDNLALLSDTLTNSSYRVLVATDGESALEQINYLQPDIILLDVLMPGIDGFETCKRLKANPITAKIPVLFMTALSDLDKLLRGFNEGAVDYLIKPIRPPEVLVRVDSQLRQARNIQRAESVLNSSPYSAFTVTSEGLITWLPETAKHWLCEIIRPSELSGKIKLGGFLPEQLLLWFKNLLLTTETIEYTPYERDSGGVRFSLQLSPCKNTNEFLLVLEKRSRQWNLDSVTTSLGLTMREAEILMWISRGKTNKEVGLILGSSPRTVNKHLEHIFEKLGVVTRAAAVSIAMQRTTNLGLSTEAN